MEVFPPDDPLPNEVGGGPTTPQVEQMKAWDESFASLEIALQAVCDNKETSTESTINESNQIDANSIRVTDEKDYSNEMKRKWTDEAVNSPENNEPKCKRVNNLVPEPSETLPFSIDTSDGNYCMPNVLPQIKLETKLNPRDLYESSNLSFINQTNSTVEFSSIEPKIEIKEESSNLESLSIKNENAFSELKDAICFPKNVCEEDIKTDNIEMKSSFLFKAETTAEMFSDTNEFNFKTSSEQSFESSVGSDSKELSEIPKKECIEDCNIDSKIGIGSTANMDFYDKSSIENIEDASDKKKDKKEKKEELCDKNAKKDDKLSKKKKFERCNIRDIKLEDELDAVTLSAQKEEQERIQRLQEAQMRALQERLQQMEVEKEALSQLFSQPSEDGPNLFDSASVSETESISDEKKPDVKTEADLVLVESSDEDGKTKVKTVIPPPSEENIIDISSSSSENESDSDDSDKKDDEIMVLSDEGETEESTAEDPNNSGAHTNDCFNLLDEEGRVLVNVGHPPEDPDIFLAPQIAKVIKPHQIGGIRFLYDNVVENLERCKTFGGFGCILAHSMGLGKTVQVVSFVDVFLRHTTATLVLCIVPINTIQNWKAEFDMWVPSTSCVDEIQISSGEVRPRDYNVYTLNENFKTMSARASLIAEWQKQGGVLLMGYEMYRMLALRKMPKTPLKKSKRLKKQEMNIEPETNEQIKKSMDGN